MFSTNTIKHIFLILSILSFFSVKKINAQSELKIGTNPGQITSSAVFEVASTNKGILLPRMTTFEMNNISLPVAGLMVYNTDLQCIHYYFGGWKSQCDPANLGAWGILGNTGTNAATNFLGTTDNQDLLIKTNGAGRMRIGKNGHISLGNYNNQPIDNLGLLWGAGTFPMAFNLQDSISDFSTSLYQGMASLIKIKPAANWAGNAYASNFDIHTPTDFAGNLTGSMIGYAGDVRHYGTGTVGGLIASNNATANLGAGIVSNAYGWNGNVSNYGAGEITNAYGVRSWIQRPAGIIKNGYAFYAPDVEATNAYGMYQAGINDKNYFGGRTVIGNGSNSPDTAIIYPTLPHFNVLSVQQDDYTPAEWASSRQWYQGIGWNLRVSPTVPNKYIYGDNGAVEVKASNTQPIGILAGTVSGVINNGTGTVNSAYSEFDVYHTSSGLISDAAALRSRVANAGTGTISAAYGMDANINNNSTGTITTATAVNAKITNTSGTITNGIGINIDDIQATNAYGVYQSGKNDKNYFAGHSIIGNKQTNPDDYFLASGLTVANTLGVAEEVTSTAGKDYWFNIGSIYRITPTEPNKYLFGIGNNMEVLGTENTAWTFGIASSNRVLNTGTTALAEGGYFGISLGAAGNMTAANGFRTYVENTAGTITTAKGLDVGIRTSGGTTTNGYGLYINEIQATNDWAVYQSNNSDKNYFAGNTGIGIALPTYKLDVQGTNPLRLNGLQAGATTDSLLTSNAGVVRRLSASELVQANAWGLLGNTGTNAATNFVGTTDNMGLRFRTNNAIRQTITADGRVGVGIAAPTSAFHVAGTQSVVAEQPARFDNTITGSGAIVNGLWDWSGHFTNTTVSPTAASGNWYTGSYNLLRSASNNFTAGSILVATTSDAKYDGTGNLGALSGTNPFAHNTNTGTITSAIGSENAVGNTAGGTITNAIGTRGWVFNTSTGTINDARGLLARVKNEGTGMIQKGYGLYVEPIAGNKRWGIYQEGLNDYNYFKGRTAIGAFSEKPDTSAIYPGFKTGNLLAVQGEFTNAEYTAGGAYQGIMVGFQPNPTSTVSGTSFRAINSQISIPAGNTQNIPQLLGVSSDVGMRGTGTVGTAMGFNTGVYTATPGSSITDAFGVYSNVSATASTTINSAYALKATVKNTSGTINAGYGLHIEDIQATNDFGVYQEGADDTNYLNGNTGIGITNPTNALHINKGNNPLRLEGLQTGAITDQLITVDATGVARQMTASSFVQANAWALDGNNVTAIKNLGTTSNFDLPIITNNTEKMRVMTDGKVGISTATPNSTFHVAGSIATAIRLINTDYTVDATDYTLVVEPTAPMTLTLPTPASCAGRTYIIKKMNTVNAVTFSSALYLDSVNTLTTTTMATTLSIQSDGTRWLIVNRF